MCRNKEGREYSDFINIKIIGKKRNQRDGVGAERRNNGLEKYLKQAVLPAACKFIRSNRQRWDYYLKFSLSEFSLCPCLSDSIHLILLFTQKILFYFS